MKKRILAFFLAFSLCLGLSGQAFAAQVSRGELREEYGGIDRVDRADSTPYASAKLSAAERGLYNLLKEKFRQVADGQLDSSVFTLDVSGLGIYRTGSGQVSVNTYAIQRALLMECPYEQYWFEKTEGWTSSYYYDSTNRVTEFTFKCHTTEDYAQAGSSPNTYRPNFPDVSKTRAAAVMSNAWSLVRQNSGKSDYEKLAAYRDYICAQVEYDHRAVENSDKYGYYGAPWQLINVFDNNPQTNVVCEGYSKAFQYLCDISAFSNNIECYQATGRTTGDHMWNTVRVNGRSYMVDLTACDSQWGQFGDLFLAGTPNSTADGFTIHYPRHTLPDGRSFSAGSDTYAYDNDIKSVYDSSILTLAPTGLKASDLAAPEPTPTPTPTPQPPAPAEPKTDFENLVMHELAPSGYSFDDQEYTLGSKPADLSVLVLGSYDSSNTHRTLKIIKDELAGLGVSDARIYLVETNHNGTAGQDAVRQWLKQNPSYVHVIASGSAKNPYRKVFFDVTEASEGKTYAAGESATMPAVVVLDKTSWPFYYASYKTFDQNAFRLAVASYGESFSDVPAGAYYEKAVNWALSGKITVGTGDNKFSPTKTCTHAQIITFLWRAMGEPKSSTYGPPSGAELPRSHFAYDALCWAQSKGMLFNLDSADSVDEPCTRAQAMFYIWSAFNSPSGGSASFSDVPSYLFYADAVSWAVDLGVTNGTGSGKFSPDTVCDRGTIVTFLHRAFVEEVRVK